MLVQPHLPWATGAATAKATAATVAVAGCQSHHRAQPRAHVYPLTDLPAQSLSRWELLWLSPENVALRLTEPCTGAKGVLCRACVWAAEEGGGMCALGAYTCMPWPCRHAQGKGAGGVRGHQGLPG